MTTTFSSKVQILADLWMNYRDDEDFTDFVDYNDIGLPLAYMIDNSIVDNPNAIASKFIEETFALLLKGLEIQEDTGFETLEDVLSAPMGD